MPVVTAGVIALGQEQKLKILDAVARRRGFDEDNDPYGERGNPNELRAIASAPHGSTQVKLAASDTSPLPL